MTVDEGFTQMNTTLVQTKKIAKLNYLVFSCTSGLNYSFINIYCSAFPKT